MESEYSLRYSHENFTGPRVVYIIYCLFCVVLCIVCVYMCTVLLPPGGYPVAVNKYIIPYPILSQMKPIHAPYHIYFKSILIVSSYQRPFLTKQSFPFTFSKQKFAYDFLIAFHRIITFTFHIIEGQHTINSILMARGLSF